MKQKLMAPNCGKIWSLAPICLFTFPAFATVGTYLPQDQNPPFSCAILYLNNEQEKRVVGLCTGDVISGDQIATAGHCEQGLSNNPTYVRCPGGILRQVSHRETHPRYAGSGSQFDQSVLTVSEQFGIEPVKFPRPDQMDSLLRLNNCTISGYGLNNENRAGRVNTVRVNLDANGPSFGPGMIGLAGNSLPRQGDSGGGLICRDASGAPYRVATVSQAEAGIANVARVDGVLDWLQAQTAGHPGAEPETLASVKRNLDNTCASTADCLRILGNNRNLPTHVFSALEQLQRQYAMAMEEKLSITLPAENQAAADASSQENLSIILRLKDLTGRFARILADCQRSADPRNMVERLEAENGFDYTEIQRYESCLGRLSFAAAALGDVLQSTIDRQCGQRPRYPEPNAQERTALNLATTTAGRIDLLSATDQQIEESGQSACAGLRDRHLVNLCVQEFKSKALSSFSCSSGGRTINRICGVGSSAAQNVDLGTATSISAARQAIQERLTQQCSAYTNQIAIRLCNESGRQAVASKFRGCSGAPSVITSDDFQGRWNGSRSVPTENPCRSGRYGVRSYGYTIDMSAAGAVVDIGAVRLPNGRSVVPTFDGGGISDRLRERMHRDNVCHEVELQADQIICRRGTRVMTYRIPQSSDQTRDDRSPRAPPRESTRESYEACVAQLNIAANADTSGSLRSNLNSVIARQCRR